jgi:hypothetical protein
MGRKCSPNASRHRPTVCSLHLLKSGKMQPVLARARDLSCSHSPGCKPRRRECGDPVIVGEHRCCRMGRPVVMRGRIGSCSERRQTIERGFGLGLSVAVVALLIGWFRTVLRCGASSSVGTLAERFILDRSDSQIEKFIDFGSYYTRTALSGIEVSCQFGKLRYGESYPIAIVTRTETAILNRSVLHWNRSSLALARRGNERNDGKSSAWLRRIHCWLTNCRYTGCPTH